MCFLIDAPWIELSRPGRKTLNEIESYGRWSSNGPKLMDLEKVQKRNDMTNQPTSANSYRYTYTTTHVTLYTYVHVYARVMTTCDFVSLTQQRC